MDFIIIAFLVIFTIFPSKSFVLRYLFEFAIFFILISWFNWRRIITERNLIISIIFIILIIIHTFTYPNFSELEDAIRLLIFILFLAFLSNKISFSIIDSTLLILLLLNVIFVQYIENGDSYNLSKFIHEVDLESSHGRHSGFFTNVATLGLFSMIVLVYNIASISYGNTKTYLRVFMVLLSTYLLFQSGSKTSMLVAIIITGFIFLNKLKYKSSLKSIIFFIPMIILFIYFFIYVINIDYRELNTLLFILSGNIQTASTVFTRLDIWMDIIRVSCSNMSYLLFGTPKIVLDSVTTTFDNDYIWFFSRFGLTGIIVYLTILISLFKDMYILRKKRKSHLILLWVFVSIMISGLGVGVVTTPQVITICLIMMSPVINNKFNIYDKNFLKY